ncbi:MAG: hypothetical protein ABWY19_09875 [Marmoricola sp.]
MTNNFAPDLTSFVVAFVLIDLLAALVIVGLATVAVTDFVTVNHARRVRQHEGLFSYYGHLALGR